jgi:hypothetical protein
MTQGFQHQDKTLGYSPPRAMPAPQHGQKADVKWLKMREPRSVLPRPGY